MSAPPLVLISVFLFIFAGKVRGSHFRGGVISWRPVDALPSSNIAQIEISYRMAWRSSQAGHSCTAEQIVQRTLFAGEGSIGCPTTPCGGLSHQLSYVCTDFSETDDWTSGVGSVVFQPNTASFEIVFAGCCWLTNLLVGQGEDWRLTTSVDLSVRADTGRINSSPTTSSLPIIDYHQECHDTITIPVADADGDYVKCFWATHCGDGCFNLAGAVLDNDRCEITWNATSSSIGLYGVAIEVMDFATRTSSVPFSFIPLHFLVNVFTRQISCLDQPVFIPPTRVQSSCVGIPQNGTYYETIVVKSSSVNISITAITTISPVGMIKSELLPYHLGQSTEYYVNTTWKPSTYGEEEIFCFIAKTNIGSSSAQTCIKLISGTPPPEIINVQPVNGDHVFLEDLLVTVYYDQNVSLPTRSTIISIHTLLNGTRVYQIDSHNVQEVDFPGDNTLQFTIPALYLREKTSYYILMEPGAARTTTFCGVESTAITDPNQWTFDVVIQEPIVLQCGPTSFQIDIPRKLIENLFKAGTILYLVGDPVDSSCRSFENDRYISLNSSITKCGTRYTDNDTQSFYTSTVVNYESNSNVIVEYTSLRIPVTCKYNRSKTLHTQFMTFSDYTSIRAKGEFVYDFAIYKNISYTSKYNLYPVHTQIGTNLFFRAELIRAPDNLEIHLRSCRATASPAYEDDLVYEFIRDGCAANNATVRVLKPETQSQADFEITSFRFRRDVGEKYSHIWAHCEVLNCDVDDEDSECRRGCEVDRYRRSIKDSDRKVQKLVIGPILLQRNDEGYEKVKTSDDEDHSDVFTVAPLPVVSITMGISLMIMGVALFRAMRRLN